MSYASEFLIENGILKEYYGSGGIIEIPFGVTEIAPYAFCYCEIERLIIPKSMVRIKKEALRRVKSLVTIEICGTTLKLGKDLFTDDGQIPYIVAPRMPLGDVPQEYKKYFCLGFAKEEKSFTPGYYETYIKYIKHQRKELYGVAVSGEDLLRLMVREKMISRDESQNLISELSLGDKTELCSEIIRYQAENFKPVDPLKQMMREANRDPFSVCEIKKTWEYEKISDTEVRIKVYKGNDSSVLIPPRVGKNTVTEIGSGCFWFQNRPRPEKGTKENPLKEVYIPDTVTVIGKRAFDGCVDLEKIHLPKDLIILSQGCFEDCRSLSEIEIPDKTEIIGSRAFLRCDGLSDLIIPKSVNTVESYAFSSCRGLKTVTFKGPTDSIQTEAFSDCINLEKAVIKNGTRHIGYGIFGDCENLEEIYLPGSIEEIGRNAFYGCRNLTIFSETGSFAEEYAKEHRIGFSEHNEGGKDP